MKITLAGEEIEMLFTHKRMKIIEKQIGSVYGYTDKCALKTVTISDIVSIYYNGQEGTSYNEEQIFKKVVSDGLAIHIANTYDCLARTVFGDKAVEELEAKAKLEEETENDPEKK